MGKYSGRLRITRSRSPILQGISCQPIRKEMTTISASCTQTKLVKTSMASKKNLRPGENILHLLFIVQECLVNFPHCLNGIFDVWIIPNILQKSAKGGVFHLYHHFLLILKWEKVHS
jgi:hypothetical protein